MAADDKQTDVPDSLLDGEAFVVRLQKSGRELTVPADKTILEVLREAGIEIDTSCEQGVCGTCLTRVIEGVPEHNDLYLTDDERASGELMAVCVSRSRSKLLVLDI